MNWLQKLYETYESSTKSGADVSDELMPIAHTTQQAHVEIVLDGEGNFLRAAVLDKMRSTTLVPCSEESGGRAGSRPVPHPLCDKLQYVAADFVTYGGEVTSGFARDPQEPHRLYRIGLVAWAGSAQRHTKLDAIRRYVERGSVMADLISAEILPTGVDGKLLKVWDGARDAAPAIFRLMSNTQSPENAFVRWRVEDREAGHDEATGTWQDPTLIESWIAYYAGTQASTGYCMVLGRIATLAIQHPAKLRNSGDKAKLISSNDDSGYTFRGRFLEAREAVTVGYEVTQKAHNALRWLIARQGSRNGDQAIVAWAVSGKPIPNPMAGTYELLGLDATHAPVLIANADLAQAFALRLKGAIGGYGAALDPSEGILVMAFDSATPGRLAITFQREIIGSEFLARIEAWHSHCAWMQNFGKSSKFIGAPSPRDIAQAAYGRRLDEKLEKDVRERLLPCIVDGAVIPRDLVASTFRRAVNRVGLDAWEWEKCLGIACGLFKGSHPERKYQMALERERTTRDYLFGRLLAIADHIEGRALYVAGESRDTTAARLMQRFADRPGPTWRTIELALVPYKTRLRNSRPGFLLHLEREIDRIMTSFVGDAFMQNSALTAEFLLGFHCQRQDFWQTDLVAKEIDTAQTTI